MFIIGRGCIGCIPEESFKESGSLQLKFKRNKGKNEETLLPGNMPGGAAR
jgi:hypothetical protein